MSYEPQPSSWWDRNMVPRLIKTCCSQPEIMVARQRIVPQAVGDVFELGCGGGINMPLYDRAQIKSFAGLDPSSKLLDAARMTAQALGLPGEIRAGIGEALPFGAASFDTVVCTFTLCSVHDQAQVLSEIRRVMRPGGKALFLEHGAAPESGVAKWQRRIEPVWKRIGGNCHLTRAVTGAYQTAGFNIVGADKGYMPKAPKPFGWVEWGEARLA